MISQRVWQNKGNTLVDLNQIYFCDLDQQSDAISTVQNETSILKNYVDHFPDRLVWLIVC